MSDTYLLAYKIFAILIGFLSLLLGFWVYSGGRKKKTNQAFLSLVFSTSLWIFLYYLVIASKEASQAEFWAKMGLGTVSLFYIPYYLFIIYFLQLEKRFKILSRFISIWGILLFSFTISTNWVVKGVEFGEVGVDILLGRGSIPVFLTAILLSIFVISLLFKKYFKAPGQEKLKIQYFLIGIFLWTSLNFIFNMIPPLFQGKNTPAAAIGNLSAIFLLGFTALAIVKKELFGIKVVLTQMLVGIMAILLFVNLVISKSVFEYAWKGTMFGMFLLFGRLLIRGSLQEIERRKKIEEMAKDLRVAYKNIEELSNMKTEFLKVVNHQLRTPVTIVKGMASMLYEGTVKKGQRKDFIKNLYISSERLTTILNDILMAQRLLGGTEELRFEPCSIEDIVKECISACEVRNEMENLQIVLEKPKSDLPITLADKENIERSIRRLIDNAILYTDKGKINISLSLKREGDKKFIKISIKDSGIGFSKKDAQNLFKLFYRGDQATRMHTNGSGLGLFIVKNLIEAHKGRVEATSKGEGKGAKFIISLPVVTEV